MATTTDQVYNATTMQASPKGKWFIVPTENLSKIRCGIKVVEVLFSCVAFVVEEIVSNCSSCGPLYFFEFVSCTAFLFTLLLLILLATTLHQKVGIKSWSTLDFSYTLGMAVLFLLASIVFAADNGGTSMEQTAMIFGFLASIAFFVDFGLFYKERGNPCKNRTSQPTVNSNGPLPEREKLNANGTD